jgi:hypothetical protein
MATVWANRCQWSGREPVHVDTVWRVPMCYRSWCWCLQRITEVKNDKRRQLLPCPDYDVRDTSDWIKRRRKKKNNKKKGKITRKKRKSKRIKRIPSLYVHGSFSLFFCSTFEKMKRKKTKKHLKISTPPTPTHYNTVCAALGARNWRNSTLNSNYADWRSFAALLLLSPPLPLTLQQYYTSTLYISKVSLNSNWISKE